MSKQSQRRKAAALPAEIQVIVGPTVAMATVYILGDEPVTGLGEAKRLPGDVWDFDTGAEIALGRALKDAGDQLLAAHNTK